jgi:stage V sporulation protein T
LKSTGIYRKIDDLGRIVLPKELRNSLNINSGDDFEITIDNNKIILEKFSKLDSFEDIIKKFINCFYVSENSNIFVTINDRIINYNNEKVTNIISKLIKLRKIYFNDKIDKIIISEKLILKGKVIIYPIVINSDLLGSIIYVSNEDIKISIEKCKIFYNIFKNIIVNK